MRPRRAACPAPGDNRLIKPFLARLGFTLTPAQTRVLRELRRDMAGAHPMRRLLQGDVGSGKTAVAACCALMALESSYHVALMAPTEILAEQHFQTFSRWLEPLGVEVRLQTGSHKSTPRRNPQFAPLLVIGTHALIESGFAMERLGLVIIDEQHKFGVAQREQLVRKGNYPHLLVMTATPIPRTLGLTLYGELDVSVIDEPPAGRGRIKTFVRDGGQAAEGVGVHPRKTGGGPAGVRGVSARGRHGERRVEGRHGGIRESEKRCLRRTASACCMGGCRARKRSG